MKNEDKAKEILHCNECRMTITKCGDKKCGTFILLMQMAEWKDRQVEKIIDVVIENFNQYPDNAAFGKSNMIDMLIEIKKVVG